MRFSSAHQPVAFHYSIDSLARLHRNTRALDDLLDDRDPSTVRKAWRELRDNVEREAEARTAFANTLKHTILPPLFTLRETQERTRKRIKEDLKDSTAAHQEYAENVLPRLKRGYLRKCQEVEVRTVTDVVLSPCTDDCSCATTPIHHRSCEHMIDHTQALLPLPLRPTYRLCLLQYLVGQASARNRHLSRRIYRRQDWCLPRLVLAPLTLRHAIGRRVLAPNPSQTSPIRGRRASISSSGSWIKAEGSVPLLVVH